MKSKFKFGDLVLFLSTVFVFVLSIVLWIFIMSNDQYFSHIDQSNGVAQTQSRNRHDKSVADLYMPTSAYRVENGTVERLYDSKNNLSLEFTREAKKAKFSGLQKVSSTQSKYEQLLSDPDFIQLSFPDEIALKIFNKQDSKIKNQKFRRIFISTSNDWLYIGNDYKTSVYRVKVKKANFNKLREFAQKPSKKTPVKFVHLKQGYATFYLKPSTWRIFSYLTSAQSNSYFVSRLLGTAKVSNRTTKHRWLTYSLNYYTKLRVPAEKNDSNNFLYTRYEKVKFLKEASCLENSIAYVHRLGISEQDLRFFDTNDNVVCYTNYVEGIPVFQNQHDIQVKASFAPESVEIAFNRVNLQIPIPFDGETKDLPPTSTVINELVAQGLKTTDLQRIVVGYKAQKDNSRDDLLNLEPTYYLKINNKWRSLAEWQQQDLTTLTANKQVDSRREN